MIQVDIISGFLGAGKTTLITKLAGYFMSKGQKVVVIENEYGQVGIDNTFLEQEGFSVYEITQGCICCTLRGDFESALMEIAHTGKPDRILIEPSGIFMLSEALSIFHSPQIKAVCRVNAVITIVDSLLYLRQSERFSEFLGNQIHHASKLVLSKADRVSPLSLEYIIADIGRLHFHGAVIPADLNRIPMESLAALLEPGAGHIHAGQCDHNSHNDHCQHDHDHAPHHRFDSMQFSPARSYTSDELQKILSALAQGSAGSVIRLKGFVQGLGGPLEISYVDGDFTIKERKKEVAPVLSLIGEHLDEAGIKAMFE